MVQNSNLQRRKWVVLIEVQTNWLGAQRDVKSLESWQGFYSFDFLSIDVASGSSADWAYNEGIKHSYALELRDEGQYGFTLPADQIKPCAEEFYAGIDAMVHHILGINDQDYLRIGNKHNKKYKMFGLI